MSSFKSPIAINLSRKRVQATNTAQQTKQTTLDIAVTSIKHKVDEKMKRDASAELDYIMQAQREESDKMQQAGQTLSKQGVRSNNRINKILVGSPYMIRQEGNKTTLQTRPHKSSATSHKTATTVKESGKCGQKRLATTKIGKQPSLKDFIRVDDLMAISQTASPPMVHHGRKNPKAETFNLKKMVQRKGGEEKICYQFSLYEQKDLNMCMKDGHRLSHWQPEKLEAEFDYQTDQDLLQHSKMMLDQDLYHAVHFFVTDDPLLVVQNLSHKPDGI